MPPRPADRRCTRHARKPACKRRRRRSADRDSPVANDQAEKRQQRDERSNQRQRFDGFCAAVVRPYAPDADDAPRIARCRPRLMRPRHSLDDLTHRQHLPSAHPFRPVPDIADAPRMRYAGTIPEDAARWKMWFVTKM